MSSNYKIFAIMIISIIAVMPIATGYAASYTAVCNSNENTVTVAYFTTGFYNEGGDESTIALDGIVKYREVSDNGVTKKVIHGKYKLSSDNLELRMSRNASCPELSYSISAMAVPQVLSGSSSPVTLSNAVVSIELDNGYTWDSSDGLWKLNGSSGVAELQVNDDTLGAEIYISIPYTNPAVIGQSDSIAVDLKIDVVGIDKSLNGIYTEKTTVSFELIPNLLPDMKDENSRLKKFYLDEVPHNSNWSLNRPVDYGSHSAVNVWRDGNTSGGIADQRGKLDLKLNVINKAFLIVFTHKENDQPGSCSIPLKVTCGSSVYSGTVSYTGGTVFVGPSNDGGLITYSTIPDDSTWFNSQVGGTSTIAITKGKHLDTKLAMDLIFV